jgi:hypothetical protein
VSIENDRMKIAGITVILEKICYNIENEKGMVKIEDRGNSKILRKIKNKMVNALSREDAGKGYQ